MSKTKTRSAAVLMVILVSGFFLFYEVQGRQPDPDIALAIMTFNVGTFNAETPDMIRVGELISKTGIPDVLLLQEVPGEGAEVRGQRSEDSRSAKLGSLPIRKLAESLQMEFSVFESYPSGKDGLAVISRHPLKKLKTFYFDGYASLAAEADVEGEKVLLLSVHLERVEGVRVTETAVALPLASALKLLKREMTQATPRTKAVDEMLAWLKKQEYDHVIIAGDFNTVPVSKAIRKMEARYDDALWPGFKYFVGSYNKLSLPIKPRIDYIFHSPGLKRITVSVIKESAGDHYPVRAVFDL